MKVGDLVRFEGHTSQHGAVGLIVEIVYANDIRWLKLYGFQNLTSEIGWKVIGESRGG